MSSHTEAWDNILTLSQVTKVKVQTIMDHLACSEELTAQQMVVLFSIHTHAVSTIGDVSKKILLQQANMSALLKKMEQQGLLKRERNQEDVRIVNLSLTDDGREKVGRILIIIEEMYQKISNDKEIEFDLAEIQRGFLALSQMIDYFYEDQFKEDLLLSLKNKK